MAAGVTRIGPGERREAVATAGMFREQAVADAGVWAGYVRTAAGMDAGWHHHADHESVIYVLSGTLTMEFGPGGGESVEAGAGDFLHVPARVVHRETNRMDTEGELVVFRCGSGEVVVNVDGPDPG